MKKLFTWFMTMALTMAFAIPGVAQDFQSGDLLYEIISEDPPEVSLFGHVDGQNALGELDIPATVTFEGTDYTVAEISWYAFHDCHGLTGTLVIPNTVRVIGEYAFYECDGLSGSLVFPESLREVKVGAFCHCAGFTGTLTFPASVSKIGGGRYNYNLEASGAFQGCLGFDHLELPTSLQDIGRYCFADCANLTGQLVLPEGVKNISHNAFENCAGLTGTLVIPESVEEVVDEAFKGCSGIESLVLPSHFVFHYLNPSQLWTTSNSVFMGCEGLTYVEIPEGWERTGLGTFQNCANLASVSLPESLSVIDDNCFKNCAGLSEVVFPEGLTKIGTHAFSECVSLTDARLPKSLTELCTGAFDGCTGLTGDMLIPDLVEEVTLFAFEGCTGLNRVFLGSSVNHVYEAAFNNTQLESLVIRAITPPQLERFNYPYAWDFPADLPITVPCGTLEAYQNAEGWNEFNNISEGNTFLLRVLTDDEHKGMVRVTKEPVCGDMSVEVTADPVEGNNFLYWEVNGETVSNDNPYRFELVEDTEITAVFSGMGVGEHEWELSLYPNPTPRNTVITLSRNNVNNAHHESPSFLLITPLGQPVLSGTISSDPFQLNLSSLAPGLYFITINNHTQKLLIQ